MRAVYYDYIVLIVTVALNATVTTAAHNEFTPAVNKGDQISDLIGHFLALQLSLVLALHCSVLPPPGFTVCLISCHASSLWSCLSDAEVWFRYPVAMLVLCHYV